MKCSCTFGHDLSKSWAFEQALRFPSLSNLLATNLPPLLCAPHPAPPSPALLLLLPLRPALDEIFHLALDPLQRHLLAIPTDISTTTTTTYEDNLISSNSDLGKENLPLLLI